MFIIRKKLSMDKTILEIIDTSNKDLEKEELQDGLLSFTTDDGKIHLDYVDENNELQRKTFYSGKLTFGAHVYDGSTSS